MRIALGVEYDGADYFGWQRQREVNSIQLQLENALAKVADHSVEANCAGRTDAGVHATGQVVHFDTDAERPDKAWCMGVNTYLPDNIAVTWVKRTEDDFHARFSATARRYKYIIYNNKLRGGILRYGVTHVYQPLNAERMQQAALCLIGEHDFSAFRAAMCQSNSPHRHVTHLSVYRTGSYIVVDIQANAFLHHMVRNIVGSLIAVGCEEQPIEWIAELLEGRDRTQAAATAKPHGLYLVQVTYPDNFALPHRHPGPLFLLDR